MSAPRPRDGRGGPFPPRADGDRDPGRTGWIWAVFALLYAASIPWYLPSSARPALWLGLPYWVVVSLGAGAATAAFTCYVVWRHWSDETDPPPDGPAGTPP